MAPGSPGANLRNSSAYGADVGSVKGGGKVGEAGRDAEGDNAGAAGAVGVTGVGVDTGAAGAVGVTDAGVDGWGVDGWGVDEDGTRGGGLSEGELRGGVGIWSSFIKNYLLEKGSSVGALTVREVLNMCHQNTGRNGAFGHALCCHPITTDKNEKSCCYPKKSLRSRGSF